MILAKLVTNDLGGVSTATVNHQEITLDRAASTTAVVNHGMNVATLITAIVHHKLNVVT